MKILPICSLVLILAGGSVEAGTPPILDVDFSVCGIPTPPNPNGIDVDPAAVATTLHGVWLGERTFETPGPAIDYAMVFDVEAQKGLVYEDIGVATNAFAEFFPKPPETAPRLGYLLCKGQGFPPSIDRFVKVSAEPAEGIEALAAVSGIPTAGLTIPEAWQLLVDKGYFEDPRTTVLTGAFFKAVLLTPLPGPPFQQVHLRFESEFRGNEEASKEFIKGEPRSGFAEGDFQGVETDDGTFIVSVGEKASFNFQGNGTPMIVYTKLTLGPLEPASELFRDGFESGNTAAWSRTEEPVAPTEKKQQL